jgi:hypothetical protein
MDRQRAITGWQGTGPQAQHAMRRRWIILLLLTQSHILRFLSYSIETSMQKCEFEPVTNTIAAVAPYTL